MAKAIEEEEERLTSLPKAVVVGVGAEDGLGAALSRCYAANGHHVLVAGRTLEKVEKVAAAIRLDGGRATAHAVDATREEDVIGLFDAAMADDELGSPADLVTLQCRHQPEDRFPANESFDLRGLLALEHAQRILGWP